MTYLRMRREGEAEQTLRRALEIKPSLEVCLLLAQIMIAQGQQPEAEALLDQAHAIEPRHGGVAIARGDLLALRGKFAEALASYEKAQQIDPYRTEALAQTRIAGLRQHMSRLEQIRFRCSGFRLVERPPRPVNPRGP